MIECQYYRSPRPHVYKHGNGIEEVFESSAWCELNEAACDLEYQGKCEEYEQETKNG